MKKQANMVLMEGNVSSLVEATDLPNGDTVAKFQITHHKEKLDDTYTYTVECWNGVADAAIELAKMDVPVRAIGYLKRERIVAARLEF